MSILYLDASAITKLVVAEAESDELRDHVRGQRIATSRVAVVEVGKAVARADPTADIQDTLTKLAFVELDAELASTAAGTGGADLRALDAIHVASALRLGPGVDSFLTYDARQAEAARTAGLRVRAPGLRDQAASAQVADEPDEPETSRG